MGNNVDSDGIENVIKVQPLIEFSNKTTLSTTIENEIGNWLFTSYFSACHLKVSKFN